MRIERRPPLLQLNAGYAVHANGTYQSMHPLQERNKLWMDRARGSGLWYWRGRTLTIRDLANCGSECDMATRSRRMKERAALHETLVIENRVGDNGQAAGTRAGVPCSPGHVRVPFYKVEIVSVP